MTERQELGSLEAMLFAHAEPVETARLADALRLDADEVTTLLQKLQKRYDEQESGMVILYFEPDRWQMTTRPYYGEMVKRILDTRRNAPLSPAALEVLAVIAYTPRPDQQSRMLRQARNPRNDGIAPLARIDLDQPQIVIAEHFAPHQRLERNAAVRVVRHESDITHIGIERADQVDILVHIVAVQAAAGSPDRIGQRGHIDRIAPVALRHIERRERDPVHTRVAAEKGDIIGKISLGEKRGPRLLPQQHHCLELLILPVTIQNVPHPFLPLRRFGKALAPHVLDDNLIRHLFLDDRLFEIGNKPGHAPRVGIVRGDDQNDALPGIDLCPKGTGNERQQQEEKHCRGSCYFSDRTGCNNTEYRHRPIEPLNTVVPAQYAGRRNASTLHNK